MAAVEQGEEKKSGPSAYLSYAEEEELACFLKKCADIGYPRTKTEVLVMVKQIIDSKGLRKTVSNGW